MKRLSRLLFPTVYCLFASASALLLVPTPAVRAASAAGGGPVDVNFFYDQLKDQGSWFTTTEYGDVWQPYIAYKNDAWRPYTDGYWTYTDGGWMFVSYESFGWAVYHYGRWTHLQDVGWAWVPGTEWAPAWVTWRSSDPNGPATPPGTANVAATSTDAPAAAPANPSAPPSGGVDNGPGGPDGGGYVGWAPLPPEAVYNDGYEYGPTVDVDFGIDPYDYCFVGIGAFGAPWLGGVLFDRGRGYYCCEHSVNITHLYYNRAGAYRGVYAGGPNFDRLRGRTAQPIAQLRIDRRGAPGAGPLDRVDGRNASVFAPRFSRNGVAPNGRVRFDRQTALKAAVLPGAQRGGGANAQAQNSAREAFTRQGQDFREHSLRSAAGGPGKTSVLATPNGVQSVPETSRTLPGPQEARPGTPAPEKTARTVTSTRSGRQSRGSSSHHGGGRRTQSTRGSHHSGGHGGGGHSGGGHSGGGHSGGGHSGGGKKH